jgi:PAS domain S-box-containing protein
MTDVHGQQPSSDDDGHDDLIGSAGSIRTVTLPGVAASAGAARRMVREVLTAAGRIEWVDTAELACSEVVSNVVLHARTDLELTVEVFGDSARVQVRDFSPVLPVRRNYSSQATTGRGMALVAMLSVDHGVSDSGPDGKTVWFTVTGESSEQSDDDLLAAWDDDGWEHGELPAETADAAADERSMAVRLLGLPPMLWLAARQHHDALIRELVLYLAEHDRVELVLDVTAVDRAGRVVSTAVLAAVEHAQQSGAARRVLPAGHPSPLPDVPEPMDLQLQVPAGLGSAFGAMQDTLDAAERLAGSGMLLARPGLPEIIAVRDWACEQITAQLAGVAPSPWPGADLEQFAAAAAGRAEVPEPHDWDVAAVRDSERGVVASDEANRIVAVSRSLADALGWAVEDLVGRRVVTLIPPRLREAHVAGFTRHLTTGEAHVLDVPLTLPVLCADGSEITADFLVQQAPTGAGRSVYLAWIDPR